MISVLGNWGLYSIWDLIRMILDVSLVAYILYRLLLLIRGTRAVPLINGLFILFLANLVAKWADLYTMQFILSNVFIAASVAIPIIFQPELRRALEHLGRGRLLGTNLRTDDPKEEEMVGVIDQIVRAMEILGRTKTGALVVIERETGLAEYMERATKLDAAVSWELLINIFVPNTPLHDGAVIIRGSRVAAAACWLPLAEASIISQELGTRHRAGIGVTEQSDAVTIIVSEETGTISLAQGGKLLPHLDEKTLRENLTTLLEVKRPATPRSFWHWGAAS